MRKDKTKLVSVEDAWWAEIKRKEKEGKEWQADYLPGAFKEAEELIKKARERKGF